MFWAVGIFMSLQLKHLPYVIRIFNVIKSELVIIMNLLNNLQL